MKIRPAAIAALTLTAILALTGCAGNTGSGDGMEGMDHGGSSSAPAETVDANDAFIMFASMMKEHHAQAIAMSDVLLSIARRLRRAPSCSRLPCRTPGQART